MVSGSGSLILGAGLVGTIPAPSELMCLPELAHADPVIRLLLALAMLALWWSKNNNHNNPPPVLGCGCQNKTRQEAHTEGA